MAKLSDEEIAAYARAGGFVEEAHIKTAVQVAKAESGGDPKKHNTTPPDNSYGLWQINMYGPLGPDRRKRFGLKRNEELFDPKVNARAAHQIFVDEGWKAWTTYTNGIYTKEAVDNIANAALKGMQESIKPNDPLTSMVAGLVNFKSSVDDFGKTFLKAVESFSGLLIGLVLLIVGVVILLRKPIGNVVSKVKPL